MKNMQQHLREMFEDVRRFLVGEGLCRLGVVQMNAKGDVTKEFDFLAEARLGKPLLPGLTKQSQAIRTFQEAGRNKRMREVAVKFAAMDSVLAERRIIMGDDSIVKGSVSEGGAVWSVYNAGAATLEYWVSYGPMFFPSFKEWRHGRECLDELAVQRAFRGDNPYDKTPEEINVKVAALLGWIGSVTILSRV